MFPIDDALMVTVSEDGYLSNYPAGQHGPHMYNGQFYVPLFHEGGTIQMYKSSDEGASWSVVGTGPSCQETYYTDDEVFHYVENLASVLVGDKIYVLHLEDVAESDAFSPTAHLLVSTFNIGSDSWTGTSSNGPLAYAGGGPSDSVAKRIYLAYRSDDTALVAFYSRQAVVDSAYWNSFVTDKRVGRVACVTYSLSSSTWGSEINMFEAGTVDSWEPCGICAGSEGRLHCVARSDPQGANVATGVRLHYAHQTLALTGPQGVQVVVEGTQITSGRPSPYHPGSVEIEGVTYVYFATQGAYNGNTNSSSVSVWCAASANTPSFSEAVQSTIGGRGCGPSGKLYPASAVSYFQRTEYDLIFRAIADVGCDWEFGGVNFSPPSPGGDYIEQVSVGQPWGNSIAFAELDYPGTPVGSGTLYRHRPVRAIITLVEEGTPSCCCTYDSGGG